MSIYAIMYTSYFYLIILALIYFDIVSEELETVQSYCYFHKTISLKCIETIVMHILNASSNISRLIVKYQFYSSTVKMIK